MHITLGYSDVNADKPLTMLTLTHRSMYSVH